ncbi:hypothetical protein J6590_016997 [Homalodisca vitripennis]|nr:hypothetical protein J6590_016997 [Homalodisca vitripennis]
MDEIQFSTGFNVISMCPVIHSPILWYDLISEARQVCTRQNVTRHAVVSSALYRPRLETRFDLARLVTGYIPVLAPRLFPQLPLCFALPPSWLASGVARPPPCPPPPYPIMPVKVLFDLSVKCSWIHYARYSVQVELWVQICGYKQRSTTAPVPGPRASTEADRN